MIKIQIKLQKTDLEQSFLPDTVKQLLAGSHLPAEEGA